MKRNDELIPQEITEERRIESRVTTNADLRASSVATGQVHEDKRVHSRKMWLVGGGGCEILRRCITEAGRWLVGQV